MKNIFSSSIVDKGIFKDERYLYPEFIPEKLPFRESEINSLVYCFTPLLRGKKVQNVFLAGSTGVGKTVCAKFVLKQLEEASNRAKSIYLNCFEYNSRASVLSAIANFVGAAVPRRGLATDEIFTRLLESLEKCGFTPIVVLDEVDQLLLSNQNSKILYDLLRIIEYDNFRIGLVLISNDVALTSKLDSRIKSSLMEQTIFFEPYTPIQLKSILFDRAELAFEKGVLKQGVINLAAAHAAKLGGDARVALEALLKAGRFAEKSGESFVSEEHLRQAFVEVDSVSALKSLSHLSSQELSLLKLVAEKQPISSGEIYSNYSSLKDRRLRILLSNLEKKNLLGEN